MWINTPKGNDWILSLKIDFIPKQKRAPRLIFFNEKNWERFRWWDIENWKSNFGTFWQLTVNTKFKMSIVSLGKNLTNSVSPVWKFHKPYCYNRDLFGHIGHTYMFSQTCYRWLIPLVLGPNYYFTKMNPNLQ